MLCICGFKASAYSVENTHTLPETETKAREKKRNKKKNDEKKKTKNDFFQW
jgi:hypothetical protein